MRRGLLGVPLGSGVCGVGGRLQNKKTMYGVCFHRGLACTGHTHPCEGLGGSTAIPLTAHIGRGQAPTVWLSFPHSGRFSEREGSLPLVAEDRMAPCPLFWGDFGLLR